METLAVVIVTYNSVDSVEALLDGLSDALAGAHATTIVVDNGSTDGTLELLRNRDDIVIVAGDNIGYAGGINRGMSEVPEAAAYLLLNADLRLESGCIPPLLEALKAEGVGIAAPRVEDEKGALVLSLRRQPSLGRAAGLSWTGLPALSEYVTDPLEYTTAHDVDWALGAALAVSRACADAVGPWDESFFLYSEETDYCLRAAELGYRTRFVPSSLVVHAGGGSGRSDLTHTMLIVNRVRLYARRHNATAGYAYMALNVLSELTWVIRGHRESRASIRGLLCPRTRPAQLSCGDSLLPV